MTDQATVQRIVEFHGHMCPGLAMGIRAAEIGLAQVGAHAADEEVVAIVETDMCGVDAIQFLTGCTFGKGNLIHRDYGKNAYTFCRRSDGHSIRVVTKPGAWGAPEPEGEELFAAARAGTAAPAELERLSALRRARSERILATPVEDLYDVAPVDADIAPLARIHTSIPCANCGEATMETRVRLLGGATLCPPCFEERIAGRTRVATPVAVGS